jgi:hypothetical protein
MPSKAKTACAKLQILIKKTTDSISSISGAQPKKSELQSVSVALKQPFA